MVLRQRNDRIKLPVEDSPLLPKLFLLLSIFLAGAARAQGLHVMSYNIKGLPSAILSSEYQDSRYGMIGKLLAKRTGEGNSPDIVALQEAFSGLSQNLIDAAGYPHVAQGPAATSLIGVSSGLFILSRYRILRQAHMSFGSKNCLSWDCFSNKGVQMALLDVPGLPKPLEVFNTHLQAGREDSSARRAQVKILLEFFRKEHQPGNPVVFAGDFNFRPGLAQQSHDDFVAGSRLLHAGKFCLDKGCAKGSDDGWHGIWARAVDHQFYSTDGPVSFTPMLVERTYREKVEGLRLSDHPAHEVKYELSWQEKVPGKPRALATERARSGTSVP